MFREVVNQVIATDRSLSGIKPTLDAAINKAVKIAIEDKLKDWLRGGKDLFAWPFKDVKIDWSTVIDSPREPKPRGV